MCLFGHFVADDVANGSDYHAVNGSDTEGEQVGNYSAGNNSDDGAPFNLLELYLSAGLILVAVHKVAEHDDDADGRQGGVEHAKEGAEIVVQPHCEHGAQCAGEEHHGFFAHAGDVSQAQAGGVERVIVGGPNIETQNKHCGPEET